jgi:hypothetical protein
MDDRFALMQALMAVPETVGNMAGNLFFDVGATGAEALQDPAMLVRAMLGDRDLGAQFQENRQQRRDQLPTFTPGSATAAQQQKLADAVAPLAQSLVEQYPNETESVMQYLNDPSVMSTLQAVEAFGISTSRLARGATDAFKQSMNAPSYIDEIGGALLARGAPGAEVDIAAYHGTPHTFPAESRVLRDGKEQWILERERKPSDQLLETAPFGRFRDEKIGTGEGAQAFGSGVAYLGQKRGTAEWYRENLSGFRTTDPVENIRRKTNIGLSGAKVLDQYMSDLGNNMPNAKWKEQMVQDAKALHQDNFEVVEDTGQFYISDKNDPLNSFGPFPDGESAVDELMYGEDFLADYDIKVIEDLKLGDFDGSPNQTQISGKHMYDFLSDVNSPLEQTMIINAVDTLSEGIVRGYNDLDYGDDIGQDVYFYLDEMGVDDYFNNITDKEMLEAAAKHGIPIPEDGLPGWYSNTGDNTRELIQEAMTPEVESAVERAKQVLWSGTRPREIILDKAEDVGSLYEAELSDVANEDFLVWDEPYHRQPEQVQRALSDAPIYPSDMDVLDTARKLSDDVLAEDLEMMYGSPTDMFDRKWTDLPRSELEDAILADFEEFGEIWGVNPFQPEETGAQMYRKLAKAMEIPNQTQYMEKWLYPLMHKYDIPGDIKPGQTAGNWAAELIKEHGYKFTPQELSNVRQLIQSPDLRASDWLQRGDVPGTKHYDAGSRGRPTPKFGRWETKLLNVFDSSKNQAEAVDTLVRMYRDSDKAEYRKLVEETLPKLIEKRDRGPSYNFVPFRSEDVPIRARNDVDVFTKLTESFLQGGPQ